MDKVVPSCVIHMNNIVHMNPEMDAVLESFQHDVDGTK